MLVARQVVADAKLAERDDVILPAFVRRERSRHAPMKGAGAAEQHDGFVLAVKVLEIHKPVADRDFRNVSNKLFRHTRRLPIDVSICTLRNDLRAQNKLGLALTTLRAFARDNLPDILWPIYALGGIGVAILLYSIGHFVMVPSP